MTDESNARVTLTMLGYTSEQEGIDSTCDGASESIP